MDSEKLYFEVHGERLLKERGMTKAAFARELGIFKQNVNSVFATMNVSYPGHLVSVGTSFR